MRSTQANDPRAQRAYEVYYNTPGRPSLFDWKQHLFDVTCVGYTGDRNGQRRVTRFDCLPDAVQSNCHHLAFWDAVPRVNSSLAPAGDIWMEHVVRKIDVEDDAGMSADGQ